MSSLSPELGNGRRGSKASFGRRGSNTSIGERSASVLSDFSPSRRSKSPALSDSGVCAEVMDLMETPEYSWAVMFTKRECEKYGYLAVKQWLKVLNDFVENRKWNHVGQHYLYMLSASIKMDDGLGSIFETLSGGKALSTIVQAWNVDFKFEKSRNLRYEEDSMRWCTSGSVYACDIATYLVKRAEKEDVIPVIGDVLEMLANMFETFHIMSITCTMPLLEALMDHSETLFKKVSEFLYIYIPQILTEPNTKDTKVQWNCQAHSASALDLKQRAAHLLSKAMKPTRQRRASWWEPSSETSSDTQEKTNTLMNAATAGVHLLTRARRNSQRRKSQPNPESTLSPAVPTAEPHPLPDLPRALDGGRIPMDKYCLAERSDIAQRVSVLAKQWDSLNNRHRVTAEAIIDAVQDAQPKVNTSADKLDAIYVCTPAQKEKVAGSAKYCTSFYAAISACAPHGKIFVHPGDYQENLVFDKPLSIEGLSDMDRKVNLSGNAPLASLTFKPGCGKIKISNIILRTKSDTQAAIEVLGGEPRLTNLTTTSIVVAGNAKPLISKCTIGRLHLKEKAGGTYIDNKFKNSPTTSIIVESTGHAGFIKNIIERGMERTVLVSGPETNPRFFFNTISHDTILGTQSVINQSVNAMHAAVQVADKAEPEFYGNSICRSAIGLAIYGGAGGRYIENYIGDNYTGIRCLQEGDPVIERNFISNNTQQGVHITQSSTVTLSENTLWCSQTNILVDGGACPTIESNVLVSIRQEIDGEPEMGICFSDANGHVKRNEISGIEGIGLGISGNSNPNIHDNRIFGPWKFGAVFVRGGGKGDIRDNDIISGIVGVCVEDNGAPLVESNVFKRNTHAIKVTKEGEGIFQNNEVTESTSAQVLISDGGNPLLQKNEIHSGKLHGMHCDARAKGTVKDNEIYSNKKSGVYVTDNAETEFTLNQIRRNICSGVHITNNGRGNFVDNEIYGNYEANVRIENGGPVLTSNDIYNGEASGVLILKKALGTLSKNKIHDNAECGIDARDQCPGIVITGNQIYLNEKAGISTSKEAHPTVTENKIYGHRAAPGILCTDGGRGMFTANQVQTCLYGARIESGANPIIKENYFQDNTEVGVLSRESGSGLVEKNTISQNDIAGIRVENLGDTEFIQNEIFSNPIGIQASQLGKGKFKNNSIHGNQSAGAVLSGNAFPYFSKNRFLEAPFHIVSELDGAGVFEDNDIWSCAQSCIRIKGCMNLKFLRNEIHESRQTAVVIESGEPDFIDNKIYSAKGSGVEIKSGSPSFMGNDIADNGESGLLLDGDSKGSFVNNTFHRNPFNITIRGDANPYLKDNTIAAAHETGIKITAGGRGSLKHNVFEGSWFGIEISEGADPTIEDNQFYKHTHHGIRIHSSGKGCIKNNEFHSNQQTGICIESDSEPIITKNRIHKCCKAGIMVTNGGRGTIQENHIYANTPGPAILVTKEGNPIVRQNDLDQAEEFAVVVSDEGRGTFTDNQFHHNAGAGMCIESGGDPVVERNSFIKTPTGIVVRHNGVGKITNNRLTHLTTGIIIHDEGSPLIATNILSHLKICIEAKDNASGLLEYNTLQESESGVTIAGACSDFLIQNNLFNNLSDVGVLVDCALDGKLDILCNKFYRNKHGCEVRNGIPTIDSNYFSENNIGMMLSGGTPIVTRNSVHKSVEAGVHACGDTKPTCMKLFIAACEVAIMFGGEAGGTWADMIISQNSSNGVFISEEAQPTLEKCFVYGNGKNGIVCKGMAAPKISDSHIWGNLGYAIMLHGETDPHFVQCKVWDHAMGLRVAAGGKGRFENCQFIDILEHAIIIEDAGACSISDCTIGGCKNNGIVVCDESEATFTSNTIFKCHHGVHTMNRAHAKFIGNTVQGCEASGIHIKGGTCEFEDNDISEMPLFAMIIDGFTVFRNNKMHHSSGHGVIVKGAKAHLINNEIWGCKKTGLVLSHEANPTMEGNDIMDSHLGVSVESGSKGRFSGNAMIDNVTLAMTIGKGCKPDMVGNLLWTRANDQAVYIQGNDFTLDRTNDVRASAPSTRPGKMSKEERTDRETLIKHKYSQVHRDQEATIKEAEGWTDICKEKIMATKELIQVEEPDTVIPFGYQMNTFRRPAKRPLLLAEDIADDLDLSVRPPSPTDSVQTGTGSQKGSLTSKTRKRSTSSVKKDSTHSTKLLRRVSMKAEAVKSFSNILSVPPEGNLLDAKVYSGRRATVGVLELGRRGSVNGRQRSGSKSGKSVSPSARPTPRARGSTAGSTATSQKSPGLTGTLTTNPNDNFAGSPATALRRRSSARIITEQPDQALLPPEEGQASPESAMTYGHGSLVTPLLSGRRSSTQASPSNPTD